MSDRTFPPGFLWGVASAGHQNEGNNTNSDTWFVENVSPTVFKEPSGIACDGFDRWREDVGLPADLGLTPKPSAGVYAAIAKAHAVTSA